MIDKELIRDMTNAFGPAGFEEDVVRVIKKYAEKFSPENDAMLNVYAKLSQNNGKKPVVLLDAHSDEVGFMVHHVNAKGLIGFVNLGGWVTTNIPAHTVLIKTARGEYVKGVLTSRPPHFMTDGERSAPLEVESILIDVGATSREEVLEDFGIQVGDPIAPDVEFSYNEKNGILFGKAFDNRLGCVCIIEALKALSVKGELPVDVVGAFAAQEEVGTRGAQVTGQVVKPDLAIVFEGSPADDFLADSHTIQGGLKKGVQIRHMDASYVSHGEYIRFAKERAEEKGIRYQSTVRRKGGTNAGKLHMAGQAVPVLVLGVPSRYVHTHYNYGAMEDIECAVALAVEVIENLTLQNIDRILKKNL